MSIVLALFSTFFNALGITLKSRLVNKKFKEHISAQQRLTTGATVNVVLLCLLAMAVIAFLSYVLFHPTFFPKPYSRLGWIGISIGLESIYIIERILKTIAFGIGDTTVIAALSSITPLFILFFDFLFLKENITVQKIIGTTLLVGAILVAVIKF